METFESLLQLMIVCTKIVTKKEIAFAITLSKSLNKPGKNGYSSFFSVGDVDGKSAKLKL